MVHKVVLGLGLSNALGALTNWHCETTCLQPNTNIANVPKIV